MHQFFVLLENILFTLVYSITLVHSYFILIFVNPRELRWGSYNFLRNHILLFCESLKSDIHPKVKKAGKNGYLRETRICLKMRKIGPKWPIYNVFLFVYLVIYLKHSAVTFFWVWVLVRFHILCMNFILNFFFWKWKQKPGVQQYTSLVSSF